MGYAEFREGVTWYREWFRDLVLFFGWDPRGDGGGRIPGAPEEVQLGRHTRGRQFRAVPIARPSKSTVSPR